MRIRLMEMMERIFHNTNEDYVLNIKVYGTKEELNNLNRKIREMI